MRSPRSPFTHLCLIAALCLCAAAPSFGQQPSSVAVLRVTVADANQRPVPGALCSLLRGAGDTQAVATATTDGQGIANFLSVAPGSYTLRVEREGFDPYNKNGVIIKEDSAVEIAVALAVASVAENVTVEAASEVSTSVGAGASTPAANLQRQSLQRLPLAAARIDEALPLVPGVVRSTTGEISIGGAAEQQSALLINGLNASDPATGNFRLNLPVDSVEAVQVFQHPYTAEYGQFTGGLTRIETRRGGDRLHFEVNDFLPDLRFREGKIRGIADDSPRLNFNGPLVADRVFFSQSLSYTFSRTQVRGLDFPFDETKTESASSFTQLDLLLSSSHTQTFTFGYFPERNSFVGLDFFRPQPTTPNYRQRNFVFTARDNYTLAGGLLESAVSFKRFNSNVWGQGAADETLTPTVEQGNYFATEGGRSGRFELFEVYTFPARKFITGTHEIKAGFDFNSVKSRMTFDARPVNITREDGTLAERITFHNSRQIRAHNREYVGFVQDRWLVRPNLSLDLGLRYEDQRIADESSLAPRAGLAWSPFKGERTVLRGGVGLFYDKVPLNIRSFARYPARTVTRFGADGLTAAGSIQFNNVLVSTAPVEPLDFRRSNRDAGFVPENLKWNVQLDQTVTPWLMLRANFTASRTEHIYIVNPELDFRGQSAIVLRSAGSATYRALELTARFLLKEKKADDAIYVSYVRSRSRGDLNDFNMFFGDFGSPVIRQNQYSNLPFDVPNRLIAWGTINLPRRFSIAPIFEARSGFPFSVRDAGQNFLGLRNSDRTRFPSFAALDVELAKEFQVTKKYGVRLSLRGFNLMNHFNPRDVHANTADPQFGKFFASYRRYFTGGFDILF
jgi:hypothetical protein